MMQLCDVFRGLGDDAFLTLLRGVSIGRLRAYQLFDRIKTRAHLIKMNSENLRKAAPRLWTRLMEGDDDLARDLAQAILVSQLDLVREVLDFLAIPHEDGFFAKDAAVADHLTEGWEGRVWEQFKTKHTRPALLFYINHLGWETGKLTEVHLPE